MGLLDNGFGSDDTSGQPAASSPAPYNGLLGDASSASNSASSAGFDPRTLALLNMLGGFNAGIAPYLGASRLPISTGQVLAAGAAGAQQGLMSALNSGAERNLRQAQARNLGLEGDLAALNLEGWRRYQQQNNGLSPSAGASLAGSTVPAGIAVNPNAPGGAPGSAFTADPNAPGAQLRPTTPAGLLAPQSPPTAGSLLAGTTVPASAGAPAVPSAGNQPPPLFGVASLTHQIQALMAFPQGQAMAQKLMELLPKVGPNTYLAVDGSVQPMPNSMNVLSGQEFAKTSGQKAAELQYAAPITSATEWAKVAPGLYLDWNKTHDLSRPGSLLLQGGRVVAQTPVPLEGVNPDGTPYREYRYLLGNPGAQPPPPAPSSAPGGSAYVPGSTLLGGGSVLPSGRTVGQAIASAPDTSGSLLAAPPSAQGNGGTPTPPTLTGVNEQGLPRVQSGLSPLAKTSAEARGKSLEELGAQLDTNADNAVQNNALIDQMRSESQTWQMGKFADIKNDALAYLQGFGKTFNLDTSGIDQRVGDFQAFNKNSMELVRQAVRATSSRAAVQEYQMIQQALPSAEMSEQGFGQIADQLQSFNDFHIAKQQAAQSWRQGHNGTLDGFNADWNAKMSPSAFLMHRLAATNPDALQTVVSRMAQSSEGVAYLKRLQGELQYGKQAGLFGE